jgi:hypothetical protein
MTYSRRISPSAEPKITAVPAMLPSVICADRQSGNATNTPTTSGTTAISAIHDQLNSVTVVSSMVHHHAITVSKVELPTTATAPARPHTATLSAESRVLRLAGIALVLGCCIGAAALEEVYDPLHLLRTHDAAQVAWIAATALALANGFALGLVLLMIGIRQLSLTRTPQTRRGVLARMVAVNLLLPCVLFAMIVDGDYLGKEIYERWYVWPSLIGYVLLARASMRLLRSGWKYDAPTAAELLAADTRAPVLYLRSFAIDDQILATADGIWARFHGALMYTATVSPEQEMAFIMDGIGPVVAIGRPGEILPQLAQHADMFRTRPGATRSVR